MRSLKLGWDTVEVGSVCGKGCLAFGNFLFVVVFSGNTFIFGDLEVCEEECIWDDVAAFVLALVETQTQQVKVKSPCQVNQHQELT